MTLEGTESWREQRELSKLIRCVAPPTLIYPLLPEYEAQRIRSRLCVYVHMYVGEQLVNADSLRSFLTADVWTRHSRKSTGVTVTLTVVRAHSSVTLNRDSEAACTLARAKWNPAAIHLIIYISFLL